MINRVPLGNGKNNRLKAYTIPESTSLLQLIQMLNTGLFVDVTANNDGTGTSALGTALTKESLFSDTTAPLYGLTGTDAIPDKAFAVMPFTASFLAFAGNVNAGMLDAAFGKNNEATMIGIGRQMAMYAWYKGDSKVTFPFTNLMLCNKFNDIFNSPFAFQELVQSNTLLTLIAASPYALAVYNSYITTETVQLGQMFASIGTASPASYASFSAVCTDRTLVESIFTVANTAKINAIIAAVTGLSDKLDNYEYTGVKRTLMLANLSITSVTSAAEFCATATLKSRLAAVIAVEAARIFMLNVTAIKNGINAATSLHQTISQTTDSNTPASCIFSIGNALLLRVWIARDTASISVSFSEGRLTPTAAITTGATGNWNGLSVEPSGWWDQFATNPKIIGTNSWGGGYVMNVKYIACV